MEVIQEVFYLSNVAFQTEGQILKYLISNGLKIVSAMKLEAPHIEGYLIVVVEGTTEALKPFAGLVSTMPSDWRLERMGLT